MKKYIDSFNNFYNKTQIILVFIFLLIVFCTINKKTKCDQSKTISVFGSAEKIVEADLVTVPITFKIYGKDEEKLNNDIKKNSSILKDFLLQNNILLSEIFVLPSKILNKNMNDYGIDKDNIIIIESTTIITTKDIKKIEKIATNIFSLCEKNLSASFNYFHQMKYEISDISIIENDLMSQVMQNALDHANKIAKQYDSKIDKIQKISFEKIKINDFPDGYQDNKYKKISLSAKITYSIKEGSNKN